MADNYLEKRMEEYRAGKLAPKSRVVVHAAGAKREPGDFTLSFPKLNAVVIGGPTELAGMLVGYSEALMPQWRSATLIRSGARRWLRLRDADTIHLIRLMYQSLKE